jgi:hypothetical protein
VSHDKQGNEIGAEVASRTGADAEDAGVATPKTFEAEEVDRRGNWFAVPDTAPHHAVLSPRAERGRTPGIGGGLPVKTEMGPGETWAPFGF